LEWKNAEHQIDEARHLFYTAAVPRPYLRADVVNYFLLRQSSAQCTGKPQIKTWVIDQHDRVGFTFLNFVERLVKLFSKITILSNYFPQTKDRRVANPIFELLAGNLAHLRTTASDEMNPAIAGQLAEGTHQRGPVIVRTRFACNE